MNFKDIVLTVVSRAVEINVGFTRIEKPKTDIALFVKIVFQNMPSNDIRPKEKR